MHCEDGFSVSNENDVTVLAIADGAGSAKYTNAKDGADTICDTMCRFFSMKFDEFFDVCNEYEMRRILSAVCMNSLENKAKELGLDSVETMASTMLVIAMKENKAIACQIGDGLIGMKIGNALTSVFLPQSGEFAGTTYFINDKKSYQLIQIRKFFLQSVSNIFLMSDGISDSVFDDTNGVFNNVMNMLIKYTELSDGCEKLAECIKNNIVDQNPLSDDCTMIIASLSADKSDVGVTCDTQSESKSQIKWRMRKK